MRAQVVRDREAAARTTKIANPAEEDGERMSWKQPRL
jgi:hypothetical protein